MAFDHEGFLARYGFSAQQFVNLVACGQLSAVGLPAERAELVAAKAALQKLGDPDKINAGSDNRKIQDLADAVNRVAAAKAIIAAWSAREGFARQFADGEIEWDHFRSYLGAFANELIDAGVIQPSLVKAALVAVLA